jgi:hypothetical protein
MLSTHHYTCDIVRQPEEIFSHAVPIWYGHESVVSGEWSVVSTEPYTDICLYTSRDVRRPG